MIDPVAKSLENPFNRWSRLSRWAEPAGLVLLLLYLGAIFGAVMFTNEGVIERDGFYHARYAQLLPERGLSRALPWMQFSDWKEHFCDKDFLYHVYLMPFTRNATTPLPGAKWGTLMLLLATLGAVYFVLKKWRAPLPLVWVALTAVGSAAFLSRMFMVRSHCLSVLLMVIAVHVILKRRFWPCFAMAFLYAWSYSAPFAMLITACAAEVGRVIVDRDWKAASRMPLATAAGLAAGLIIHPYTPYALKSFWMLIEIARSGVVGSPLELGTEFRHMALNAAFTVSIGSSLAALAALGGGLVLLSGKLTRSKLAPETAALVAVSTAWFLSMFFTFERFIEYATPLSALACGFVARDLFVPLPLSKDGPTAPTGTSRLRFFAVCGVAVLALGWMHSWTVSLTRASIEVNSKPPLPPPGPRRTDQAIVAWYRGRFFDGATKWMRTHLQPGTVVANFYWDDFPELFYSAPEMYYLVGLDPTIMRLKFPEKSAALEGMRMREFPGQAPRVDKPIDFAELKRLFGTDYTILRRTMALKYKDLVDPATGELKTEAAHGSLVFSDSEAVIYSLEK